ncbi:MAG: GMC family oxidoreductase [Massilia sp.]
MSEPFDIDQQWDAVIVGTGMGGATLGYALARAGKRVLFLEKGLNHTGNPDALLGDYAEAHFGRDEAPMPAHRDTLAKAGRYQAPLDDRSKPRLNTFIPFVGQGSGGSTALYGMALERFFPADFTPRSAFADVGESSLPDAWPISYAELAPHYAAAEALFRVRGSADPLRGEDARGHFMTPPPLTPASDELFKFFENQQLHPYRLPMACEFVPGCEGCQGYLCAKECKNDANRICLQPAIRDHRACLLDACEVLRVEADSAAARSVVYRRHGVERSVRADIIVLAAGALETPRLLLDSASADWPDGLANASGQVGRNLMRHHIDLYLIEPKLKGEFDNRQKEFAFNDFYQADGQKLGSVQSFGRLPPARMLAASLVDDLRQGPMPWSASLFSMVKPAVNPVLRQMVERRMVLATTIEDFPYADNQVMPSHGGDGQARLSMQYRVRPRDQARIDAMRARMKAVLRPYAFLLIKQAENNQRIAHVCGTCRFGDDPRDSVLDKHNRAHGLANLYVLDSSFFPSSGGTNPSLTIAANALRVGAHLLQTVLSGETHETV